LIGIGVGIGIGALYSCELLANNEDEAVNILCLQLQCNSSNRYKKQDVEFFCCKLKSKLEETKTLQVGATQNPTLICTTGVKKEIVVQHKKQIHVTSYR